MRNACSTAILCAQPLGRSRLLRDKIVAPDAESENFKDNQYYQTVGCSRYAIARLSASRTV